MDLLIAYDVNTESKAGRSRLRRMAKLCLDFGGQRVQKSVFECSLEGKRVDEFLCRATEIVSPRVDSLRLYWLRGGRDAAVRVLGVDRYARRAAVDVL